MKRFGIYFNPKIVRLKLLPVRFLPVRFLHFNPKIVRLKPSRFCKDSGTKKRLQSKNSPIKKILIVKKYGSLQNFNPTIVRLKHHLHVL